MSLIEDFIKNYEILKQSIHQNQDGLNGIHLTKEEVNNYFCENKVDYYIVFENTHPKNKHRKEL